jgi:hypothetical protein
MADITAIERELAEKGHELRRLRASAAAPAIEELRSEIAIGVRAFAVILGFALGFGAIAYIHTNYPVEVEGPRPPCP